METTVSRDGGNTTMSADNPQQRVNGESHQTPVLCHDLRQAIDMLRAVPSGRGAARPHRTHKRSTVDAARQPLRPVNHHSNRLSLPPQLSRSTNVVPDYLAVRQCASLTDDVVQSSRLSVDAAPSSTDRSAVVSGCALPWKVRRVKKQKLEQVFVDNSLASDSKHHHHHYHHCRSQSSGDAGSGQYKGHRQFISADCCADSDDDIIDDQQENKRRSESSESLDTIVERILENAAMESERRRQKLSKRRRAEHAATNNGGRQHQNERQYVDKHRPHSTVSTSATHRHSAPANCDKQSSCVAAKQQQDRTSNELSRRHHSSCVSSAARQEPVRQEKTLEDLFEEAVESLRDDTESANDSTVPQQRRRLRSSENWERQILDSELHDQCRSYHVQTFTDRDFTHVSRGFAVVGQHKTQKKPDLEASRKDRAVKSDAGQRPGEHGDTAYLQRTVISAKAAAASNDSPRLPSAQPPSQSPAPIEENVDLCLDGELAANERRRASRSSSVTWDSVSVDSLVMYEDDRTTVQTAAAAVYVSSTAASAERRQLDEEFVEKLRRLQDEWRPQPAEDDDDDAVWVPMSRHSDDHVVMTRDAADTKHDQTSSSTTLVDSATRDSHKPETDKTVTSHVVAAADDAAVLSDSVTSQQVVVNIKLPRRSRGTSSSKHQVPRVPFREIRLRREIRFTDDAVQTNSPSGITDGENHHGLMTSSTDRKSRGAEVDVATQDDGGMLLTANGLLSSVDVTSMCVGAEVEYQNTDSSRSVEVVPVCDGVGRQTSRRVDVSRRDATRVVHLPTTSTSQLVYTTPSIAETVDSIRSALVSEAAAGARVRGVSVSCEAVETVSRRGDSAPPQVLNIVVDCLPPPPETGGGARLEPARTEKVLETVSEEAEVDDENKS